LNLGGLSAELHDHRLLLERARVGGAERGLRQQSGTRFASGFFFDFDVVIRHADGGIFSKGDLNRFV